MMSSVRVFELAREYGIDSKVLIDRISSIGINASDHLTALDSDTVDRVRELLRNSPSGGVVEERVTRTVVRRRARRGRESDAAVDTVASDISPPSAEPGVEVAAVPEDVPEVAEAPSPGSEAAETAAPSADAPAAEVEHSPEPGEAPAETAPAEPPAEPGEPTPEPPASAPPHLTVVTAPPPEAEDAPEATVTAQVVAPPADAARRRPTMERAVIVLTEADRRVAEAVARTRAEKGYDTTRTGHQSDPTQIRREPALRPGQRAAPPGPVTPGARVAADPAKKRSPGKRLVYDKKREHLLRRGMLDHDEIFRGGRPKKKKARVKKSFANSLTAMKEAKRVVKMGEAITISELAMAMMVKGTEVIQKLMSLGVMATVNQAIDLETAQLVADEFEWRVESVAFDLSDYLELVEETDENMQPRPPVVTVMGHVDHGKTSLLDCIRKTRVVDGEAGGITQHMGAYVVELPDRGKVVFIDTPGHEAFTAMRARGTQATDIVVLVVAADDGVMPQTIESINHARAAKVPIVVAINKIDKNNANPDRVLTELSEHGLVSEEWGGDTITARISALKNEGIEGLLEQILLQAEVLELRANPSKAARGVVLEGRLERGRGPVATLLGLAGTLEVGDTIVSGTTMGRVRAMNDDRGNAVKLASPSMPVEVIGLSSVPNASDEFYKVKDEKAAQKIVSHQEDEVRKTAQVAAPRVSLDSLHEMLKQGAVNELKIIVKADVHGSTRFRS